MEVTVNRSAYCQNESKHKKDQKRILSSFALGFAAITKAATEQKRPAQKQQNQAYRKRREKENGINQTPLNLIPRRRSLAIGKQLQYSQPNYYNKYPSILRKEFIELR